MTSNDGLLLVVGIGGILLLGSYQAEQEKKTRKIMQEENIDASTEYAPDLTKPATSTTPTKPATTKKPVTGSAPNKAQRRAAFLSQCENPAKTAGTAHFKLSEMTCTDGTPVPEKFRGNTQTLLNQLEVIRAEVIRLGWGGGLQINSGYRTPKYNDTLKGSALLSRHTVGAAADLPKPPKAPSTKAFCQMIVRLINEGKIVNGGVGYYPNHNFVHYDVLGAKARWTENSKKIAFPA